MNRLDLTTLSPLERFVRDYTEARDGIWDELEPQVYDLLLGQEMSRVAFDPEALAEHPSAQLASFGSPLLDQLLGDAAKRWNFAVFYRVGLNLHPRDLPQRVVRALPLPADASVQFENVRAMNFPQAVFWFKATFASDQKEEEILPVGTDLHYLRECRRLDALLAEDRLCNEPEIFLPQARHAGLKAGYRTAAQAVARTAASLANARQREWSGRVDKQVARMSSYYARLRDEAAERPVRGADPAEFAQRLVARRDAIDREERLRIAELRQKSSVRVSASLASLMLVQQPKLLISTTIVQKTRPLGRLEIVWDSLTESIEAPPCPNCGQPTFDLRLGRSQIHCAACSVQSKPRA